jgi:hypothetical protein
MSKEPKKTADLECVDCHERLSPNVLPVFVPEDNGGGEGKTEIWCPQCFVAVRAIRDVRWVDAVRIGQLLAISCGACGKTSVDFGRHLCGQCGSKNIVILLAKGAPIPAQTIRKFVAAHPELNPFRRRAVLGAPSGPKAPVRRYRHGLVRGAA